jgi:hypothetical protein
MQVRELLEVHDLTAVAGVQRGRQAAYEPVDGAAVGLRLQRAVATLSGISRERRSPGRRTGNSLLNNPEMPLIGCLIEPDQANPLN